MAYRFALLDQIAAQTKDIATRRAELASGVFASSTGGNNSSGNSTEETKSSAVSHQLHGKRE